MKKAFTLIELLVVVLIIGILAAVALPQYEKAVWKTRFSSYLPALRAIKNAQEVYYLENGEYASNFEDLGISLPGTLNTEKDSYASDNGFSIHVGPYYTWVTRGADFGKPRGIIIFNYDYGVGQDANHWNYTPGKMSCGAWYNHGADSLMVNICKSLTGKSAVSGVTECYVPNGFLYRYCF